MDNEYFRDEPRIIYRKVSTKNDLINLLDTILYRKVVIYTVYENKDSLLKYLEDEHFLVNQRIFVENCKIETLKFNFQIEETGPGQDNDLIYVLYSAVEQKSNIK